ncbi:hypothetical protein Pcinc_002146 [Petrolisthes cinctipes]|uniref:Uncharacterized protein n=1 Tax=Petrolisthes cinctipes TaxID=88211 RepID=A0AAE1GJA5_PETCI|nr:hypothetical protein Pcinc_002146 [Petrolisthes cinctipes]
MMKRAATPTPSIPAASSPLPFFDNFTVSAMQRLVHGNYADKQHYTVKSMTMDLKMAGIIQDITTETRVLRLMHAMGFQYRASQSKMYVGKESIDIVCRRIAALKALRHHQGGGEAGGLCKRNVVHHQNGSQPGVGRLHANCHQCYIQTSGAARKGSISWCSQVARLTAL